MNKVWDIMESFLALNFEIIFRKYDQAVDALAGKSSYFNQSHYIRYTSGGKVMYSLFVYDMVDH